MKKKLAHLLFLLLPLFAAAQTTSTYQVAFDSTNSPKSVQITDFAVITFGEPVSTIAPNVIVACRENTYKVLCENGVEFWFDVTEGLMGITVPPTPTCPNPELTVHRAAVTSSSGFVQADLPYMKVAFNINKGDVRVTTKDIMGNTISETVYKARP